MDFKGLPIYIENKKGSSRHWKDPFGKETGSTYMHYAYGYVEGTLGTDGDEVDVYIGPRQDSDRVFVITQTKKPDFTEIDEQKVMLGFDTKEQAIEAYLNQYDDPRFLHSVKVMSLSKFKESLVDDYGGIIKSLNITKGSAKLSRASVLFNSIFSHLPESPTMNKSRKEATELLKSFSSIMEDINKALEAQAAEEEDLDKALTARQIAPIVRRMRLHNYSSEAAREAREVGTSRERLAHEPPVVPVRAIETPEEPPREFSMYKSCQNCGCIHKSMGCPKCTEAARITEAVEIRFR